MVGVAQVGLFVIAATYALHQSKPVLLPLVLAILVSLVLRPVFVALRKLRLPRMVASAATVAGLIGLIVFGSYQLVQPGSKWVRTIDGELVSQRIQEVFRPVHEMQAEIKEVATRVEKATEAATEGDPEEEGSEGDGASDEESGTSGEKSENPTPEDPAPHGASIGDWDEMKLVSTGAAEEEAEPSPAKDAEPMVVEIRKDPLDALILQLQELGVGTAAFLLLVLFILAYGNGIVRCFGEDSGTARIFEQAGIDVSRFLFTITTINLCLGVAIGLAMWALGLPNPALWGVLGMVLNFIPYVGALIGAGVVFLAAAASFDTAGSVLIVPLVYLALTTLEGNVVTPMVLGRRFSINPLVVFVWIFAWAGFWGIAGMLIAMPALVTFKIICENTATLERFRRVLEA